MAKHCCNLPVGNTLAQWHPRTKGRCWFLVTGNRYRRCHCNPVKYQHLCNYRTAKTQEEFLWKRFSQPSRFVYMNKSVNGVTIFSDKNVAHSYRALICCRPATEDHFASQGCEITLFTVSALTGVMAIFTKIRNENTATPVSTCYRSNTFPVFMCITR